MKIQALVIGIPPYHPLLKDVDQRLEKRRKTLDEGMEHLRPATPAERTTNDRHGDRAFVNATP